MNNSLYYSKNCEVCSNIMKIMHNNDLLKMFELKCIDNKTYDNEISKLGITHVPTILIVQTQGGRTMRGIYSANDAFKWVDSILENRRQYQMKLADENRQLIQRNTTKNQLKYGLYDYCPEEAEGISDAYAYFNKDESKDIDAAQPKMFLPVGQDANFRVLTIPDDNKTKLSKKDQEQLMSKLTTQRTCQENQLKTMYEQQQIDCVLSNANN